jgi:dinuclear metal center YbgI/SA1388 family protein
MKISHIAAVIEQQAPLLYQESYDNAGLLTGLMADEVTGVLVAFDVTEAVVDEAIALGANLIISHHPLVFSGLKRFTGKNWVERCLLKAIRNNIAIYCAHTNLDAAANGHNKLLANKLGLHNTRVLIPVQDKLFKLVCYVPDNHLDEVRDAVFQAGSGHIGNYDSCSFSVQGTGTFRALEGAQPFVGELNTLHKEPETRFETIVPAHRLDAAIAAMKAAHPYEEVAYDVFQLEAQYQKFGTGLIGELEIEKSECEFLQLIKDECNVKAIRHSPFIGKPIKRVALCGGSGAQFMGAAMAQHADIYITGDVKYHQFFDVENKMLLADIGHYESEQFVKDWFVDILTKNFTNFALHFSKVNTNPVNIF